jgi:arylsulfatase A-like enzyme
MDGEPPSHARPAGLTPNLEKLAADGMRFSDFYATAPRCTPSRTSFVTGISPAKLHMTYQNEGGNSRREEGNGDQYLLLKMVPPPVETTLPKGVKTTGNWLGELGYASAHFGKWHVGRQAPTAIGFDLSDGPNGNQGPDRGTAPNPEQCEVITDKGIAFMREQVKAGKPFYLQISHYGYGSEEEATPAAVAKARELVPGVGGKPLGAIAGQYDMDLQLARVRGPSTSNEKDAADERADAGRSLDDEEVYARTRALFEDRIGALEQANGRLSEQLATTREELERTSREKGFIEQHYLGLAEA